MQYKTKQEALAHAKEDFPKEACGLVVIHNGEEKYLKCNNLAENPEHNFALDPECFQIAEELGEIIEVFHSHPKSKPLPSDLDKACMEWTELPWSIVNPNTEEWHRCEPAGWKPPLVGRPYHWGVNDCYTLVRDWYKQYQIILPEFKKERPKNRKLFVRNPVFDCCAKQAGFYEVEKNFKTIQKGDVLLINQGKISMGHCAVYVGDGRILHQCYNSLSSIDIYDTDLQQSTVKILRHYNWKV
jgi:proteasome lid subunit RPN8/RPN11